jgi:hypothetical protein
VNAYNVGSVSATSPKSQKYAYVIEISSNKPIRSDTFIGVKI